MRFVLDASALLTGIDLPEGEYHMPPSALEEVRSKGMTPQLEAVIATKVRVTEASPEDIASVEEVARDTGDYARLSPVDIQLLALARSVSGTLVTDDYSIQNVAEVLGIHYRVVAQEGIRKVIRWRLRCKHCHRRFDEAYDVCPVCGGPIRSWPAESP